MDCGSAWDRLELEMRGGGSLLASSSPMAERSVPFVVVSPTVVVVVSWLGTWRKLKFLVPDLNSLFPGGAALVDKVKPPATASLGGVRREERAPLQVHWATGLVLTGCLRWSSGCK